METVRAWWGLFCMWIEVEIEAPPPVERCCVCFSDCCGGKGQCVCPARFWNGGSSSMEKLQCLAQWLLWGFCGAFAALLNTSPIN